MNKSCIRVASITLTSLALWAGLAHAQQQGPSPSAAAPTQQAVVPPLPDAVKSAMPKPGAGMTEDEFAAVLKQTMPLSPAQTKEVVKQSDAVRRARNARVGPAPVPVSVSARVTLDSGANPHVLRLTTDIVTTVVFTDVTGAPWTVLRVVSGAKDLLDITSEKAEAGSNMFTISPRESYVSTNIAVFLQGAAAPIMMAVETNQAQSDFRVDISVQARGPAAVTPMISRGLSDSVPAELVSMVSGITPNQARSLKVLYSDISDVQAWVLGSRMFVRTKANILTPAVPKDGKVATGVDGTKVYELPISPEVRLMSGGSVGRLQLGGFQAPSALASK